MYDVNPVKISSSSVVMAIVAIRGLGSLCFEAEAVMVDKLTDGGHVSENDTIEQNCPNHRHSPT